MLMFVEIGPKNVPYEDEGMRICGFTNALVHVFRWSWDLPVWDQIYGRWTTESRWRRS